MELTITQNGALYALQHKPAPSYLQKRVRPDLIWSYRALKRSIEKLQATPQNAAEQVAYGFLEYRVAA
jgi:transcriptional regulator with AAA-type ATPase domain